MSLAPTVSINVAGEPTTPPCFSRLPIRPFGDPMSYITDMMSESEALDAEIDLFAEAWKLPYSIDEADHLYLGHSIYVVYEVDEEISDDANPSDDVDSIQKSCGDSICSESSESKEVNVSPTESPEEQSLKGGCWLM